MNMSQHNYTQEASTISLHAFSVVEETATQVASHALYKHLQVGEVPPDGDIISNKMLR